MIEAGTVAALFAATVLGAAGGGVAMVRPTGHPRSASLVMAAGLALEAVTHAAALLPGAAAAAAHPVSLVLTMAAAGAMLVATAALDRVAPARSQAIAAALAVVAALAALLIEGAAGPLRAAVMLGAAVLLWRVPRGAYRPAAIAAGLWAAALVLLPVLGLGAAEPAGLALAGSLLPAAAGLLFAHAGRVAGPGAALLPALLSSMGEGLLVLDPGLRVVVLNDALRRFLDLPEAEPVPDTLADVLFGLSRRGTLGEGDPEAQAAAFIGRLAEATGDEAPAFEWSLGDGRTCLVSAERMPDGGLVANFTDVTEQMNVLRVMVEARDSAEQANRAKTEFLANMTHELRSPLNTIIGFSTMIRDQVMGPVGTEAYRGYAEDIHQSGQRLLSVINDILDAARLEAGRIGLDESLLDLRASIDAVVRGLKAAAAEKKVTVAVWVHEAMPPIRADDKRLQQVIRHLLSNAIKFSPASAEVVVEAGLGEGDTIVVAITDHGIGMSAGELDVALQSFHQADGALGRRYEGAGLGLALAKGLIELHGGRLEIDSMPGKGTSVAVVLPGSRIVRDL